ncbi:hypothetical protein [Polynucleobacter sp. JS-JIR-5-A7]|uniref:hypothetical protein n=1 Tax=Polynucleobacter sp. JS-JIR-5-A7 TaxID=1758395 RepID=UPI001BFECBF4|nr:hypothetical protein [Polynucleobacter sp. JS-JIR-5-A7]QWE06948.1 hypothetical protein AOC29_01720 [Polynucleobacter sp. JS-JIR-5-A7]
MNKIFKKINTKEYIFSILLKIKLIMKIPNNGKCLAIDTPPMRLAIKKNGMKYIKKNLISKYVMDNELIITKIVKYEMATKFNIIKFGVENNESGNAKIKYLPYSCVEII